MNRTKHRRCRGQKVIFHTELDAKIALAKRVGSDKGEVRAYKCEIGNHWHLTSQSKRGHEPLDGPAES